MRAFVASKGAVRIDVPLGIHGLLGDSEVTGVVGARCTMTAAGGVRRRFSAEEKPMTAAGVHVGPIPEATSESSFVLVNQPHLPDCRTSGPRARGEMD